MDGRGRLAQSLKWLWPTRASADAAGPARARGRLRLHKKRTMLGRFVRKRLVPLLEIHLPRGIGVTLFALVVLATGTLGVARGGHGTAIVDELKNLRDAAANAVGFRISSITLVGSRHLTREEILAIAGVTGRSSLLFLDVDRARDRLTSNPWIADATVLKFYPGALKIAITEKKPFALWQKDGRVMVIAADGAVLEPYVARRFVVLPLVVGAGAATRAREFLGQLDRFPEIRRRLRAAVLVAARRWNLRLDSGIDVRLPEAGIAQALSDLVALDREQKLLSRDVLAIDLRQPDRVTVRLSDAAAARAEAFKELIKQRKGGAV